MMVTFSKEWARERKDVFLDGRRVGSIRRIGSREFDVLLDFHDLPRTLSTETNAKLIALHCIQNRYRQDQIEAGGVENEKQEGNSMTDISKLPLNGTKTHPLTPHAIGVLERISRGPILRGSINPGCADRLERENLVEVTIRPVPEKPGKETRGLTITETGRKVLEDRDA